MKENKLPKVKFATVRRLFFVMFTGLGIFSFGYVVGLQGIGIQSEYEQKVIIDRNLPQDKNDLNFNLFWRVWDILEASYFQQEDLVSAEMVYGAIQGMVASVGDPYTIFLPPKENKVVQEDLQGTFSGVGIQIGFKGTQLAVIAPLPDSPAEAVGIEAGDLIVGIKDDLKGIERGTAGITLPEAVQAIRGEQGSTVTLSLLREDVEEPIVVDVVRREIDVPSIVLEMIERDDSKLAHVKLLKFSGETESEWEQVVIDILKEPKVDGIILDVRNNPGGFLLAAVDLASDFLETGDPVVIEETKDKARTVHNASRIGRLRNRDVVVLVNEGSASASEILAGALRDQKEVILVGDTTFGKGTIQEAQDVDGGTGLHITIARWLTPSELWVNEGGLVPDIEVSNDSETEVDEQLEEAIRQLLSI